jgi:hypothetical protein
MNPVEYIFSGLLLGETTPPDDYRIGGTGGSCAVDGPLDPEASEALACTAAGGTVTCEDLSSGLGREFWCRFS